MRGEELRFGAPGLVTRRRSGCRDWRFLPLPCCQAAHATGDEPTIGDPLDQIDLLASPRAVTRRDYDLL
ncbi:hypothetical protein GCM10009665_56950 [Kitasatospora nipponensis]|uniref:Uncharacterized protein n=1 Tax=Kitasatospora nipponensis TaxID=258049 RepID=A0ABP4HGP9_9ACTN